MVNRCHGAKIPQRTALYYRDKGIKVCDEWRNDFAEFEKWAIKNGYCDDLTIDRIDSDGNYCPENCQWITKSENSKKAIADWRKKPIGEHRKEVGHFMIIERITPRHFSHFQKRYKVIQTGLYKREATEMERKLNSELPPWDRKYYARVTLDCKDGQTITWEQTGLYLNKKRKENIYE